MIQVTDLSKIYSNGKGVFDLDFQVSEGEVFGFLGPNGAGKTTTIRMLLGFTNPTKGTSSINGLDARTKTDEIQRFLGYVPGEIAFFDNMSGTEFLDFMTRMRGTNGNHRQKELIDFFELETKGRIRKMSKGMKQKLGLVAAFMHDPSVLILDEPTSGLDPLMQKRFIELILQEKKRGKTILMSSHLFDEVERTCERTAIIREGIIVAKERIDELKKTLTKSYIVTLESASDIERIKAGNLHYKLLEDRKVEIQIEEDYQPMLSVLSSCKVVDLNAPKKTLEDIFIKYYSKEDA
jgi:ABC-2 type transport system ATP-binding protein